MHKKILILTVTAGEGHNSVCRCLQNKFLSYNDVDVKTVDLFKQYGSKTQCYIVNDGYKAACKYALNTYNLIFRKMVKNGASKKDTSAAQKVAAKFMPVILNEILTFKPDVIICTHFYPGIIVSNLKRMYNLPTTTGLIITDYGISPYWDACTGIDYLFTPCEEIGEDFLKMGYIEDQIKCFGLPVKECFSSEFKKNELKDKLNLSYDMLTVSLMTGGGGFGGIEKMFKSLLKVKTPLQIIVMNGKDKKSLKKIDKLSKYNKNNHKITNLGFVDDNSIYLKASDCLVGKCGGISTTESLCLKLPLISHDKLAQQELNNLNYLTNKDACFVINKENKLNEIIEKLANDQELLNSKISNVEKIRKPKATENICEFLLNHDNIDYTDFMKLKGLSKKDTDIQFKKIRGK